MRKDLSNKTGTIIFLRKKKKQEGRRDIVYPNPLSVLYVRFFQPQTTFRKKAGVVPAFIFIYSELLPMSLVMQLFG